MGRKKQDNALGKAVIKNRFGGGRKTNKESHVSRSRSNQTNVPTGGMISALTISVTHTLVG